MRSGFRRTPVSAPSRQKSRAYTFIAPVRGLVLNESLASSGPAGARVLENWFPTQTSIRVRAGLARFATIGTTPVVSMFTYVSGASKRFFAANDANVYDITALGSVTAPPTPVITGQASGYYSSTQIATAGGEFLYIVNGTNSPQLYNGTTWTAITATSTPAITGVPTAQLSHVWKYRSRLFFIRSGTMSAFYLPVDSIGGAAAEVSLAGVFQKGGSLLTGATWSVDAGDGLDDKIVFISTEGEVAVYEGSDPSSATNWRLVGRYDVTPPLGKKALMQAGGDLLIATRDGIVPLSEVFNKDPAALSLSAVTRPIEPAWKNDVLYRGSLPWELLKWPMMNMGIVAASKDTGQTPYSWIVNLQTGAWTKYTGWDARCLALHDGWAYIGTSNGRVLKCETGGSDDGAIYTATMVGLFDQLRAPGSLKTVHSARTTFIASRPFIAKVSVSKDYGIQLPQPPNVAPDVATTDRWDVGLWDVSKWDAGVASSVSTRWQSIGASGIAIAPAVQVSSGNLSSTDAELVSFDILYEVGGVMV